MKNKGITLVALVITIVILLILAGISISALTNQGIFAQAENAKEKATISKYEESIRLAETEAIIDNYQQNGTQESILVKIRDILKIENLFKDASFTIGNSEDTGKETMTIVTSDGFLFEVTLNEDSSIKINYISKIEEINITVNYDVNGGNGILASQKKNYNVDLTLSSQVPTREGYAFLGWATSSDATEIEYEVGATYRSNSSVTLYAVWTTIVDDNNFTTISYNMKGGGTRTHTISAGTYILACKAPDNANCTITSSYFTKNDAVIKKFTEDTTVSITGNNQYAYAIIKINTENIETNLMGNMKLTNTHNETYSTSANVSVTLEQNTTYLLFTNPGGNCQGFSFNVNDTDIGVQSTGYMYTTSDSQVTFSGYSRCGGGDGGQPTTNAVVIMAIEIGKVI